MTSTITSPAPADGVLRGNETRVEGRAKVSGKMQYTADIHMPDTLWAAFTTSPLAHARILNVDTSAAKALPGFHAVLTAADIGPNRRLGRMLADLPVLAYDTVLYIGDRVAAVAAETRTIAEEAARLVEVEYEELSAVLDPFAALATDAPVLHPAYDSYAYAGGTPLTRKHPNVQGCAYISKGETDLDPLFAAAHRVYEHSFITPRQHAGYIEPRAAVVSIDAVGIVHVYTVNKQPFLVQQWMAQTLGLPIDQIVVESIAIGGDFGGKGLTTDEFVRYYLAKATGRPVKHVFTYLEELQASSVRHPAYLTLKTAVDDNGRFIAHCSEVTYNGGAYAAGKPAPTLLPGGVYSTVGCHIPNVALDVTCVYTNTIPGAHVRSPADVQCFFAWEQHVELIAAALGIDPIDLRLRNVVHDKQTAITGEHLNHPQGDAVLEALRCDIESRPVPARGAWGYAPVCRHTGGGKTAVEATLHPNGTIEIVCGVPDQGSGTYTAVQRVFATSIGIDVEYVVVRAGSTRAAQKDPGSGGSRVTYIVGNAAKVCAELLASEIEQRTGLVFGAGRFADRQGTRSLSYCDGVAEATNGRPIHVVGEFDGSKHDAEHPADYSFTAFGIHVTVDRDTGAFEIDDAVVVAEVGTIINPIGHQGQIDGGFVYGFGSSAMEEMPLGESGKLMSLSLADYKLPCMKDIPPLRTIFVESPFARGPFGAKMAGELSNSGVAPALVNAVANDVGVRLNAFPVTAERIYRALQDRDERPD